MQFWLTLKNLSSTKASMRISAALFSRSVMEHLTNKQEDPLVIQFYRGEKVTHYITIRRVLYNVAIHVSLP